MKHLLILLAFMSCDSSIPSGMDYVCSGADLDNKATVYSQMKLKCKDVLFDINLMQDLLQKHAKVPRSESEKYLKTIEIYVFKQSDFGPYPGTKDGHIWSYTDPFIGLKLNIGAYHLVHEFCHHMELAKGNVGSIWHQGWETNGYDVANEEYYNKFIKLE